MGEMTRVLLALAALLAGLPAREAAARKPVPVIREITKEEADPNLNAAPDKQDLHNVVRHLGRCIAVPSLDMDGVANIDQFLGRLEEQLRKGNDLPRDKILRNADLAREYLRLGYNDLAEATSPPQLPAARDRLNEIAEKLPKLLERNRRSVDKIERAAEIGRATSRSMVVEPPESPGQPVPLGELKSIEPLRPELLALRDKLRDGNKKLKKAKAHVARAKERSALVANLAKLAGNLDSSALGHLNERRTKGTPARYRSKMLSREVILNANKWLTKAVEKAESVVKEIEQQVDPKRDGIFKAVLIALEADRKTIDAREMASRSGQRINFNHKMRLNDVIAKGYDVAMGTRRPWWVGRAKLARGESIDDSGRLDVTAREAVDEAVDAEKATRIAVDAVRKIDEALGTGEERVLKLAYRELDVPAPSIGKGAPRVAVTNVKNKPLKIPRTLEVSDDEIMDSYDSNGAAR